MKTIFIGIVLVLLFTACTTLETPATTFAPQTDIPTPLPETTEVTPAATSTTALESPFTLPTPEATLALFDPLNPPRTGDVSLEGITSFALLPDNRAGGESAADFRARLLGGGTFTLSEQRGKYWLVLPTALGCGECMFSLSLLSQAAPEEGGNLNVLVLDIYQPDQPEYWQIYADYFGNPDYLWSVVDTTAFMEDYKIFGLGTFLVIDPLGKLVFRSDFPPRVEYISHMYTLASRQGIE